MKGVKPRVSARDSPHRRAARLPPPVSREWVKNHIDHHRGARQIRLANGAGWMADRTWLPNAAAAGIGSVAESAPRLVPMVLTHPSAAVADLASTHEFQRPIRQSVRARRECELSLGKRNSRGSLPSAALTRRGY